MPPQILLFTNPEINNPAPTPAAFPAFLITWGSYPGHMSKPGRAVIVKEGKTTVPSEGENGSAKKTLQRPK